jgi:glutamyl/glutaminyl-tRNA synthetase
MEDLDPQRCRPEFSAAAIEDLRWLDLAWEEGPDEGGPFGPYQQSARREFYFEAWKRLRDGGFIYPCLRSRKDVATAAQAPHEEEPVFPVAWRTETAIDHATPEGRNWRFRVPDHEEILFEDGLLGPVRRTALQDFGDFVVWNRDNVPAYELAVVVDDIAMAITEVVRGADLLTSTARQILLYRALQAAPPLFAHCPLLRDEHGRRLAKREKSLNLRALRERGWTPEQVRVEAQRLKT